MKITLSLLKNKYFLAFGFFLVWTLFFDRNDLISQITLKQQLNALKKDKEYYLLEIRLNRENMRDLQTNPGNLEKFAREKYLMKKDNEDIFVVVKK